MSWVEKNRKINNRGDDYSGLESNMRNFDTQDFSQLLEKNKNASLIIIDVAVRYSNLK